MSTLIRTEISKRNQYYIPKHRYLELKHFCLQYKDFKRIYNNLCEKIPGGIILENDYGSVTEDQRMYVRERYLDKINLIEECCFMADKIIGPYILKAVTEELTYSSLRLKGIPCCKDKYYELYRKFFFILSYKR